MLDARESVEGPIRRESLHEQVVGRLRHAIESGQLAPGGRIAERVLCERFGVSRTPLREALKVLASEGLIELLPNRGARVARLEPDVVGDVFQVLGALEALAAELAAERATKAERTHLERLHAEMTGHWQAGRLEEYFHANRAIHESVLAAARNPVLQAAYRNLAGRVAGARYQAPMDPAEWRAAVEDHEALMTALRGGDAAAAGAVSRRHLARKRRIVEESQQ